jgi:YggT family protein
MPIICVALQVYTVILFARVILSWTTMFWTPPAWASPAVKVIFDLTEPLLRIFRRYIPPVGGLDLSILVVFLLLRFLAGGLGC